MMPSVQFQEEEYKEHKGYLSINHLETIPAASENIERTEFGTRFPMNIGSTSVVRDEPTLFIAYNRTETSAADVNLYSVVKIQSRFAIAPGGSNDVESNWNIDSRSYCGTVIFTGPTRDFNLIRFFDRMISIGVNIGNKAELTIQLSKFSDKLAALYEHVIFVKDTMGQDVSLSLTVERDPEGESLEEVILLYRSSSYSADQYARVDQIMDQYPETLSDCGLWVSLLTDYKEK